jgi:hypothetical protein
MIITIVCGSLASSLALVLVFKVARYADRLITPSGSVSLVWGGRRSISNNTLHSTLNNTFDNTFDNTLDNTSDNTLDNTLGAS